MKLVNDLMYSFFPSEKGKEALKTLKYVLSIRGGISFDIKKVTQDSEKYYLAESNNIHNKSIVVTGKDIAELDQNIKNAIFALYEVPRYYADQSEIPSPKQIQNKKGELLKYAS